MLLIFIACFLFVLAILLLLHHGCIHGPGTEQELGGVDQYFQWSDVCNFHSCSHEMWIIAMVTVAIILVISHLILQ
jgi:hypothetical protein